MNTFHNQRGSIIIFSMLLMTVILTSSLALIGIFAPKVRSIADSINSTVAIFAADSASELCIYESRKDVNYNDGSSTMNDATLDNTATFTIQNTSPPNNYVQADCSTLASGSFGFRAVGTYRGITRALEVTQ